MATNLAKVLQPFSVRIIQFTNIPRKISDTTVAFAVTNKKVS